jgi:hypothetical protein
MMAVRPYVVVAGALLGALSCTKAPATSSPTPGTGPAAAPGGRGGQTTTAAAPAAGGTPSRRVPPSRDSLAKLRATYVATVMQSIAGHENEPADKVFKNVQVLKGLTAAQLVHKMNKDYAEALSWNCTNCHRLAPQGNFASDTSKDKVRARFMQTMQNEINQNQLPKLYPKDTPSVTCATCHRGYNEPPPGDYLAPERGKPGAPPEPPPPGGAAGKPPAARPPA